MFEMGTLKIQGRNITAWDSVFGEVLLVFKLKSNKIFRYIYSIGIYSKKSTAERRQPFSVHKKATGTRVF
jgi:hypothetical protein